MDPNQQKIHLDKSSFPIFQPQSQPIKVENSIPEPPRNIQNHQDLIILDNHSFDPIDHIDHIENDLKLFQESQFQYNQPQFNLYQEEKYFSCFGTTGGTGNLNQHTNGYGYDNYQGNGNGIGNDKEYGSIKKKGRPKGLKSNKNKNQTKQQQNPMHQFSHQNEHHLLQLHQNQKIHQKQKNKSNKNTGHWHKEQNKRYHWFLQIHSNHFIHRHLRRMDKIFKTMADFIGSRQAEQCRSHHQKMQKKYHTFYKIIKSLRNQFYMSYDSVHVKMDFQNNGIFQYDPIISQEILENQKEFGQYCNQNGNGSGGSGSGRGVRGQGKELELLIEPVEKACTNHSFFLADNYQNGLNLHNL